MFLVGMTQMAVAGEHGGQEHGGQAQAEQEGQEHGGKTHTEEHGGQEHGGTTTSAAPTNDDIRNTMKNFVETSSAATGTFDIIDPDTGKTLNLEVINIHERIGKSGDYYYSCADFKDTKSGVTYDLDLDVADRGNGQLEVADVRIHKESGDPRFTYDDSDNRIPLKEGTLSHLSNGGLINADILTISPEAN